LEFDGIRLAVDAGTGVAEIVMRRPKANAINAGTCAALGAAFARAEEDPGVRAVVLRSEAKLWCPGLDLSELSGYDRPAMREFMGRFSACVLALVDFPKPVVAAIGGHAVAGGCVLALTADWRVLRDGAHVGLNEVRIGVPLPYGVARLVQDSVPPHRLVEVGIVGRNFGGEDAVAAGLVQEAAGADAFDDRCRERAAELASREGAAYAATKRYLRAGAAEALRIGDSLYGEEWLDCWFSEPVRERIAGIVASLSARRA
jgi:enoyl-CoA hydratase/carnithine racemase